MQVMLNEQSVRLSDSKISDVIFAQIYLEVGPDSYFPECCWDDFAEIVLTWWMDEMARFLVHGSDACLRFMDGDFQVTVSNRENKIADFRLFEKGKLLKLVRADVFEFSKTVLASSRLLSRVIYNLSKGRKIDELFLVHQNALMRALRDEIHSKPKGSE